MKIIRKWIVPALLAGLVILAGCSPAQATVDLDLIKTQAVQTVMAQATLDAVLAQPTATTPPTMAPPTQTLPPAWTATLERPTATTAPQKTNTSAPTATSKPPSSGGGGGAKPTAKPPQPYDCKLVAQSPADGTLMNPAQPFDGRFTLKNTGTKTWTTDEFQFFHKSGEDFDASADGFFIDEEIDPGDSYTLVLDMVAPFNPGIYVGWWHMRSDNNEYFCSFYTAIQVK